eukprot:3393682-Amphidinium_carterae.1
MYFRTQLFCHDAVSKGSDLACPLLVAMSSSMSRNPSVAVMNQQEMAAAALKAQKAREKRARQAEKRSSDSDGYIPVEIEDTLSVSSKSRDDEIKGLEKKLALLKATRKNKIALSTDSEQSVAKMRRENLEETGFVDDEIKKSGLVCLIRSAIAHDRNLFLAKKVRNAHGDDGGWNWSGSPGEDFPGSLDLDMVPLTPISELHMRKEPYENPAPYSLVRSSLECDDRRRADP